MAKIKVAYRRKDFGALVLSFSIDPIEALGGALFWEGALFD